MKTAIRFFVLLLIFTSLARAVTQSSTAVLVTGYYRYLLNVEVESGCLQMITKGTEDEKKQIAAALDLWQKNNMRAVKESLVSNLGDNAKSEFENFVASYTKAESEGDKAYLKRLVDDMALTEDISDFNGLRDNVSNTLLASNMDEAAGFLSNVETWLTLGADNRERPPLMIWLTRNEVSDEKKPEKKRKRSLRSSEAVATEYTPVDSDDDANPLDSLSAMRGKKRDQAMMDAKAGMEMVASERASAEKEYAAKKLAQANAEAALMKSQALKMAATEKEAMDQREHSWGNRLKKIVGATMTAAGGAFLGQAGNEVGRRAVNSIFD